MNGTELCKRFKLGASALAGLVADFQASGGGSPIVATAKGVKGVRSWRFAEESPFLDFVRASVAGRLAAADKAAAAGDPGSKKDEAPSAGAVPHSSPPIEPKERSAGDDAGVVFPVSVPAVPVRSSGQRVAGVGSPGAAGTSEGGARGWLRSFFSSGEIIDDWRS